MTDWTKITFDIGEVHNAHACLQKSTNALHQAGAASLALGDLTPGAFSAYMTGQQVKADATSTAGSFGRMGSRLLQRIDHMYKFGHDLPSRWATAEGAARAAARASRLAKAVNEGHNLTEAELSRLLGDPDAAAQFLRDLNSREYERQFARLDEEDLRLADAAIAGGYGRIGKDHDAELRRLIDELSSNPRLHVQHLREVYGRFDGHPVLGGVLVTSLLATANELYVEDLREIFGPLEPDGTPKVQGSIDPAIVNAIAAHAALIEKILWSNPPSAADPSGELGDLIDRRRGIFEELLSGLSDPTNSRLDAMALALQWRGTPSPEVGAILAGHLGRYLEELRIGDAIVNRLAQTTPGIDSLASAGIGDRPPREIVDMLDTLQNSGQDARTQIDLALQQAYAAATSVPAATSILSVRYVLQSRWAAHVARTGLEGEAARWSAAGGVLNLGRGAAGLLGAPGRAVGSVVGVVTGPINSEAEFRRRLALVAEFDALTSGSQASRAEMKEWIRRRYPNDEEVQQNLNSIVDAILPLVHRGRNRS